MSPAFPTLTALLRARAATPADQPLRFLPDGETEGPALTHAALDAQARAIGAALQAAGYRPGDRALLLYAPGLDIVPAFFGALYAGLVAVPVPPPRPGGPMAEFLAFAQDAAPSVVLTTAALQQAFAPLVGTMLPAFPVVATDALPEAPAGFVPYEAVPNDLATLLYTSGSTSEPRGVMMSHGHLLRRLVGNADAFAAVLDEGAYGTLVSWTPLHHVMGFVGSVLTPLYMDLPAVVLSPLAFIEKPVRWLRAMTRYGGAASAGPTFAYALCVGKVTPEEREGLDLRAWRVAAVAAEPIRRDVLDAFAAVYGPYGFRRRAFHASYALSEANGTIDGRLSDAAPTVFVADRQALQEGRVEAAAPDANGLPLVSNGPAVPGQEVVVVDPQAHVGLGEDAVGEVWIRGPQVAEGYWRQPELTAATFHARRADTGEGPFLRTGDLGFLHGGDLYIAGRLKDVILIRGKNVHAVDVEAVAEAAHPALLPGASVAFGIPENGEEHLVLVHEVHPQHVGTDPEDLARAVRRAVGAAQGLPVHTVVFAEAGSLPRTTTGKLQRAQCRAQFLETYRPADA